MKINEKKRENMNHSIVMIARTEIWYFGSTEKVKAQII
jgi:hypothetical protein